MIGRSDPVSIEVPPLGIAVAESIHGDAFRMSPRSDPFHKLLIVLRGRTLLEMQDAPVVSLHSSHATPVSANTLHCLVDAKPATVIVLAISIGVMDELEARLSIWRSILSEGPQPLDPASFSAVRSDLQAMLHLQHSRPIPYSPSVELRMRAHVDTILTALAANNRQHRESTSYERVHTVLQRIADSPFYPWSSEDAAMRSGISPRRFTDLQREVTGQSFQRWLRSVRVCYSATLLRDQRYSVTAAAFAAGFTSLATFHRAFRQEMGFPPGEWVHRLSSEQG